MRHDLPAVALALEYLNPIALPRRHIGIGELRRERAVGYRGLPAFERLNSVNWHAQHDSFLVHPLNKFRVHAHRSAERVNLNGGRSVRCRKGIPEIILTEIGGVRPPAKVGPESTSPRSGGCRPRSGGARDRGGRREGPRNQPHLALDVREGQRLPWVNHHRVGPRRAGASQFAPVNSLGRNRELVPLGQRLKGARLKGATQVLEAPCVA